MECLYDSFFYGTVCHVCKREDNGNDKKLKRCGGCRMIFYCSLQHQKVHWSRHKRLCKCIQSIMGDIGSQNLFQKVHEDSMPEDWCKSRTNLMLLIQLKMGRRLSQTEQQMFMFPRVCEVCRDAPHETMQDCQNCHTVSYCSILHRQQDAVRHGMSCQWLKLCLHIDKYFLQAEDSYPSIKIPVRDEYEPLSYDIESFITNIRMTTCDSSKWNQSIEISLISELLTCPLTLLYALEKARTQLKGNMVMHVVGAGALECTFLQKWEVLLHCLPQLSCLDIVFIGPETEQGLETNCDLCVDCQKKSREMNTHFQCGKFYHQYATCETFLVPDVIVAYNCGLHEFEGSENDTWLLSLPFLLKFYQIPLVLTSYTKDEANKDITRLLDYKQSTVEVCLNSIKNPFASKRPYRDWGSENCKVFFQNNFITIVTRQ